jgi:hypothetical protein
MDAASAISPQLTVPELRHSCRESLDTLQSLRHLISVDASDPVLVRGYVGQAAEERAVLKADEEAIRERCHRFSLEEMEDIARVVFPAGTLPDESDPIKFTARELEILRHTEWQTDRTQMRWAQALMARGTRERKAAIARG